MDTHLDTANKIASRKQTDWTCACISKIIEWVTRANTIQNHLIDQFYMACENPNGSTSHFCCHKIKRSHRYRYLIVVTLFTERNAANIVGKSLEHRITVISSPFLFIIFLFGSSFMSFFFSFFGLSLANIPLCSKRVTIRRLCVESWENLSTHCVRWTYSTHSKDIRSCSELSSKKRAWEEENNL